MACGIKTIYSVRSFLPENIRLMLLNALVISHLQYSSILLNGISQNLLSTLEKQINWGVKACFNRLKRDSAQDLRIQYAILPVRSLLDIKAAGYFWKWKNKLLPAFKNVHIITANIKKQERTNQLVYNTFTKSQILSGCFFKRVVSLWNTLPAKIRKKDQKFDTLKGKLKRYFLDKFLSDHDRPQYSLTCWREYRFK